MDVFEVPIHLLQVCVNVVYEVYQTILDIYTLGTANQVDKGGE